MKKFMANHSLEPFEYLP